ncbi:hypothetical protein [Turkeypox virus]|uniref:DNA/pantothenate metabolism flavoprotein C-terminal domain-containing protein n=1 Tax=Turkeypox virus TaxID=336486 RepID=A0A0M3PB94_9POXV|nr:hypothetical protein ASN15_gp046 [Turkeypox virus]ALA62420.1 hypothetical protein [Turkeypox virus]
MSDDIKAWVEDQHMRKRRVILITSGGTRVSMELNAVRFLENFSTGMRGAISVERFIDAGYGVCFLHRESSLFPWSRVLPSGNVLLDKFEINGDDVQLSDNIKQPMLQGLRSYKSAIQNNQLFVINFTTLSEYIRLLRIASQAISLIGTDAIIYLAAAVSDFYIPACDMQEHKIESTEKGITISMKAVPKMMAHLVNEWAPKAFVVSFKLETNEEILIDRAKNALSKYHHQVVIANVMKTRRKKVIIVTRDKEIDLCITDEEEKDGMVLEDKFIPVIIDMHYMFLTNNNNNN